MSEGLQIWGLRAFSLAIAVGIWFMVSVEGRDAVREKTVNAAVSYQKDPSMIILNPIEEVSLRIRGRDRDVTAVAPHMVEVQIDIPQTRPGSVNISLGPENVKMPPGTSLQVTSIEPNVLELRIDREVTLRIPLEATFTGEPAAGARVLRDQVEIVPGLAVVTGPETRLLALESLALSPINLDGHALTFREPAAVISPDPLVRVVQNSRVTVHIPMDLGPGEDAQPGASR